MQIITQPRAHPARPGSLGRSLATLAGSLLGPRGCLFTFHRAVPGADWADMPNRGFHLDLDFLDRLLTHLRATGWAVVTLDEALRRATAPESGRYANFSVDDCYRDTVEAVVPLFRRHGMPVTLFLTTGIPDGTLPLWGAGLEDVLRVRDGVTLPEGPLALPSPEAKRAAYARLAAAWDGPQAGEHYRAFCRRNGVDEEAMHWRHAITWEMLDALADDPLVEIGGHTVSHARIAALDPEAAHAELAGCRERIGTRLGREARHFAFPYGRGADCGPRDFALARRAGFASAATTRKGLVRRGQDAWSLPRNTLNGSHRSLAAAEAHLTGATAAAARILGRV
ncbi:polysaccharide deacetylase family protein [Methylobacterium sp. ID0610]|uniref:polysaccharide deacetylase family protein n=1 Tax=Methylobacterium carpenticola TaxID=3344827 RepID=UPI0036A02BF6